MIIISYEARSYVNDDITDNNNDITVAVMDTVDGEDDLASFPWKLLLPVKPYTCLQP